MQVAYALQPVKGYGAVGDCRLSNHGKHREPEEIWVLSDGTKFDFGHS